MSNGERIALEKKPYTLTELSSKLDIDWQEAKKTPQQHEAIGLGRNCYIFHTARHWAYVEIRKYRGKTYNIWLQAVIDHCLKLNEGITEPMQYNEIKGIAKSISRYCWKKDAYYYQEFIDRQSRKGKLGGVKSGEVRRKNSISENKPWIEMGVSRATYYRKIKKEAHN